MEGVDTPLVSLELVGDLQTPSQLKRPDPSVSEPWATSFVPVLAPVYVITHERVSRFVQVWSLTQFFSFFVDYLTVVCPSAKLEIPHKVIMYFLGGLR